MPQPKFLVIKNNLWIHINGKTSVIPLNSTEKGRSPYAQRHVKNGKAGTHNKNSSGKICAPMPGKIIKILKKTGSVLQKGETILVMEAMKMEYSLKADSNGEVANICCAVNEQVTLGQILAEMKEAL